MRSLLIVMLCIMSLCVRAGGEATMPNREYLVGVYYFAGWWRESPNKWESAGKDWRAEYPERIPILGQHNDQKTMDREIIAASGHGVDFFQILWYPNGGKLNEGVRQFMASSEAHRMKFTIEYVNHPPFDLSTDEDWESACREWCADMKHPSYLRVGGRPVFKVHGADFFFKQNGDDNSKVTARFDTFRRIAKESGLPNPLISGGVMPGGVSSSERSGPYDFVTTYMDMPGLPQRAEPYPYESLIKHAEDGWLRYAEHSSRPYVPYVPAGWDPRPWGDPRPSFAFPTRDEWVDALRRVKSALDTHPNLGVPIRGRRQKILLVYAWNEFGEGGIMAPTRGEKDMRIEAVREVFGR